MPSRTNPIPFAGRIALGALAGVGLCRRYRQPFGPGAVAGAVGAAIGTVAGTSARQGISKSTKLPSWLLGILEDGLALCIGYLAITWREPEA
jgi:uncharacterized membrane protein